MGRPNAGCGFTFPQTPHPTRSGIRMYRRGEPHTPPSPTGRLVEGDRCSPESPHLPRPRW